MKVKRYVVMAGMQYYACGGFEDYLDSFDTKEEAIALRDKYIQENQPCVWSHVADLETGDYWQIGTAEATMARFFK